MSKAKKIFLQSNVFLFRLVFALFLSLTAQMIPKFQSYYELSLDKSGMFMMFQSLGGTLFLLIGLKLFDRIDKKNILLFAGIVFCILLFVISSIPSIVVLFMLLAMIGCSNSTIDSMTNAITGELNVEKRGMAINLLHVFFGIGAITGPFFAELLYQRFGMEKVFSVFGWITAFLCVSYLISKFLFDGKTIVGTKVQKKQHSKLVLDKKDKTNLVKVCFMIFLMAGATIIHLTWTSMYTSSHFSLSPEIGALTLSLYWGGKVIGLLLSARLTLMVEPRSFIAYGSLIGGIIFIIGLIVNVPIVFIICTALTGMIFGNVEPQILVLCMGYFPKRMGFASAIVAIMASLSVTLIPYPVGFLAEKAGLFYSMLTSGMFMIALAILTLAVIKKPKKAEISQY